MSMTALQIEELLTAYLPSEEAALRSQQVHGDMAEIGFDLELATGNPPGFWAAHDVLPQAEYKLWKTAFDINSDQDDSAMSDSFVTCGNLLRLSQCSKLGHRHVPHLWPSDFGPRLLQQEHLDALSEIWWLKFWRGLERVERGPKLNKASPDFEWVLTLRDGFVDCQINLEVKRRPGNLNRNFKYGRPDVSLSSVAKKFGPVGESTANVVAFTVFVPITVEARRWVLDWFNQQPHVHGLLIWTEGNLGTDPMLKLFKPEKRWAEFLVNGPEPEDLKVAGRTWGTLCKKSDMPAFLEKLVAAHEPSLLYRP